MSSDKTSSSSSDVDGNSEGSTERVGKGVGSKSLPSNPLTIGSLRKGQNLASSKLPFLWKLHEMLSDVERTGDDHIVSWMEHGKGFRVHRPKSFVQKIIPYYFKQSKYKSFQRQLHLYEFTRTSRGPEAGAYSHPNFVRGYKAMCLSMSPKKIKGKFQMKGKQQKAGVDAVKSTSVSTVAPQDSIYPSKVSSGPTICKADEVPSHDPVKLKSTIERVLVTGACLAVDLDEKSGKIEVCPHSGDVVYVFGGMPFRYLEGMETDNPTTVENLLDMDVDTGAILSF